MSATGNHGVHHHQKIKRRSLLLQMWEADNRCCYCKQPTIIVIRPAAYSETKLFGSTIHHPKEATIEHTKMRTFKDPRRGGGLRLACWECNTKRGSINGILNTFKKEIYEYVLRNEI